MYNVFEWMRGAWGDPLYQLLLVFLITELSLIGIQLVWLAVRSAQIARHDRLAKAFSDRLGPLFFKAVDDPGAGAVWVARARAYPVAVQRGFFGTYLAASSGEYKKRVLGLYQRLGLLEVDLEESRSRLWYRRMHAVRRLYLSGSSDLDTREALHDRREDNYPIRMLSAVALGGLGCADDLVDLLKGLHLPSRLMEQPLHAMFSSMSEEAFVSVMRRWDEFESPALKRILLATAARRAPLLCGRYLKWAAESDELELRVGACTASGKLGGPIERELVGHLARDSEWQVRGQAAAAMGEFRDEAFIPILSEMTGDSSFWVRQNASKALRQIGSAGHDMLRNLANNPDDLFAAESAAESLHRLERFQRRPSAGARA